METDPKSPRRRSTDVVPHLSEDELYEALRIKTLQESQDALVAWAKRRVWVVGVIVVVAGAVVGILSGVGLWQHVNSVVRRNFDSKLDSKIEGAIAAELQRTVAPALAQQRERVEEFQLQVSHAEKTLSETRSAIVGIAQDKPALVRAIFSPDGKHTVLGKNFGDRKGRVLVETRIGWNDPDTGGGADEPETVVEGEDVLSWSDTTIVFRATLEEPKARLDRGAPGKWREQVVSVRTADGKVSDRATMELHSPVSSHLKR